MTEREFFLNNKKKLLISDSFSNADALIKRFVLINNLPVCDIERLTISSLCNAIYKLYGDSSYTLISDIDGSYIVDYLLRANRYAFVPSQSFAISTATVFYGAIIEIKCGNIVNPNNKRYKEVLPLIKAYNKYLKDNKLLDYADMLSFANDHISEYIKTYNEDLILGVTDNLKDKLRYLERVLISKITAFCGKNDINFIEFDKYKDGINKVKIDAHGNINEIRYIAQEIKENNISFNDVDIYVSDNSYEATIKSLFDYYQIPYRFTHGESLESSPLVSIIKYALSFVNNLCELESINSMFSCGIIKEEFNGIVNHLPKMKCDHFNISKYDGFEDDNQKQFINLLLALDDPSLSIGLLYEKLLEFIKFACKEDNVNNLVNSLNEIGNHLSYINDLSCPNIEAKIKIILSFISGLKENKETNREFVRISSLNGNYVFTRKHNYLVGLSASQLTIKEIQSPVFSDDDLLDILSKKDYISLSRNNNQEKSEDINTLILSSLPGSSLHYVYSSYDAVEFKNQAPSTLYIDTNCEEIEYDYEVDIGSLNKKETSTIISPTIKKFTFSPSALELFARCPCQFILQYIEEFGKIEVPTYLNGWLNGAEYGTFSHLVLEKYFNKNNTKELQKSLNLDSLDKCIQEASNEFRSLIPYGNKSAVETDIKTASRYITSYLKDYFDDNDGYVTVACEYNFTKDNIVEAFEVDEASVIINYQGVIDRIDVKVDDEGTFYIRTIDYKTSSRSGIVTKVNKGFAFQAHIYSIAAKAFCIKHKKKLEKILNTKLNFEKEEDITNITFNYVLLKEKGNKRIVNVDEELDALSQEKLKAIVSGICKYNEAFDIEALLDSVDKTPAKAGDFSDNCQYCTFQRHCKYKIKMGETIHITNKKERAKDEDNN